MSVSFQQIQALAGGLLVKSRLVTGRDAVADVQASDDEEISLLGAARTCLLHEGVANAMELSPHEVARRVFQAFYKITDTSNTPHLISSQGLNSLLSNVVATAMKIGFTAARTSYQLLSTPHAVKDLKSCVIRSLSELSTALEVPEAAAPKLASLTDRLDAVRLRKYGLGVVLSQQALEDDQLDIATSCVAAIGRSIATCLNRLYWSTLIGNPVMSEDNGALFSAAHGNLFPAAALSEASLQTAVAAMLSQRLASPGNQQGEPGGITPAFLVVGPSQMQTALRLCGSAYQPVKGFTIEPICEPLVEVLGATGDFYVFASPDEVDFAASCFLKGRPTPTSDVRIGGVAEVKGIILDGCHYSSMIFTDYRAIVKVGA